MQFLCSTLPSTPAWVLATSVICCLMADACILPFYGKLRNSHSKFCGRTRYSGHHVGMISFLGCGLIGMIFFLTERNESLARYMARIVGAICVSVVPFTHAMERFSAQTCSCHIKCLTAYRSREGVRQTSDT